MKHLRKTLEKPRKHKKADEENPRSPGSTNSYYIFHLDLLTTTFLLFLGGVWGNFWEVLGVVLGVFWGVFGEVLGRFLEGF